MNNPKISLIAAIGENRALGKDNKLLWHIPADLQRFKRITSGHVVVMGRKTYESIGRPLPKRVNIVITRDPNFKVEGCAVAKSIDEALEKAREVEKDEIFIIGGGQIFEQTLPKADKLYLTVVSGNFDADVFFPDYSSFRKKLFEQTESSNGYTYTFKDLGK